MKDCIQKLVYNIDMSHFCGQAYEDQMYELKHWDSERNMLTQFFIALKVKLGINISFQMFLKVECKLMDGVFLPNIQLKLLKVERVLCLFLYQSTVVLLILMIPG